MVWLPRPLRDLIHVQLELVWEHLQGAAAILHELLECVRDAGKSGPP